ncbi:MAG TPA: CHAT domain-containing tetratricopeptide repeat protein, partial [Pyrinomonadaceae bacterium]|nr:CHAT domain-containing tetratricopeptide repeat protein [Pyrinomonadaceae bacterium]
AQRLVDTAAHDRDSLLRTNSALADIALAHLLKDICLQGWSVDPSRALAAADSLGKLAALAPNPEIDALRDWSFGLECLIRGEMESAINYLESSQKLFLELGQSKLAASTQVSKLIALAMLGRYDEAIDCGMRAVEVFKAEEDFLAVGKVEHNIGNIFFRRDRYREAELFHRSALDHFERAQDLIQLAKIENSLALTLSQQHKTKAAELLYEKALERAEAIGLKSTQAEIESSIGTLALYQGYYARALNFLERSRRKYADLNIPHVLALTEQEIADAYLELNLAPEAAEIYKRVAKGFNALGMHADEARALAYHGRAEILLGNFETAQRLLASARDLYSNEGNDVGAALVELTEAQLSFANGNYLVAQALAAHAELELVSAGTPRRVLFARWLQGESVRCEQLLNQAKALLSSTLGAAREAEQPDIEARCLTSLGLVQAKIGDDEAAEKHFLAAADLIERLRAPLPGEEFRSAFFSDKLVPYSELARLALRANDDRTEAALKFVEKARSRSLVDLLGGSAPVGFRREDQFESELLKAIDEKRHELSYFYKQLNQTGAVRNSDKILSLQIEVKERETSIAELSRQLRHSQRAQGVVSEELDLSRLQQSLGMNKALIEFTCLHNELLAFVLTNERVEVVRGLAVENEIDEQVLKFRFQIDSLRYGSAAIRKHINTLTQRAQQHLHSLYQKIVQPLTHLFGDRDLVIVPSGRLHYLPFHALHDGERFLVESRALSYASSATVLQQCLSRNQNSIERTVLMGVCDKRTPLIQSEIHRLHSLFKDAEVFLNKDATISRLRSVVEGADLVHLACHAQFRADNPQFSSLQLGDEWLTVNEATTLPLSCRLVTLSACETGVNAVAPGEELIGLARGFLSAGSAAVLLSLWTVDDEATHEFMVNFYSQLTQEQSASKALQRAQVDLLKTHPHPFFWSPFVLVGHW